MENYNELLIHKNKKIRVLEPQKEYEAISDGINHKGELLVKREDGTFASIYAGEVSVRGLGEDAYV
jgi:BirA family transcriptional regulator, biotin operon repressor / biotin---[acetyl-CoA-carboxylase] ligase